MYKFPGLGGPASQIRKVLKENQNNPHYSLFVALTALIPLCLFAWFVWSQVDAAFEELPSIKYSQKK